MTDKTTLRAQMKALRAGLCSPERDAAIAGYVLSAFGEEQSFFVYLSFGSEAGTEALIRALIARGKTVCVPRIAGGEMRSVPYREPLERGKYGILQPREGEEITCAVALTPLLARLGLCGTGRKGAPAGEDGHPPPRGRHRRGRHALFVNA